MIHCIKVLFLCQKRGIRKDFPFSGAAPAARAYPLRSIAKEDSRPLSRSSHANLISGSDFDSSGGQNGASERMSRFWCRACGAGVSVARLSAGIRPVLFLCVSAFPDAPPKNERRQCDREIPYRFACLHGFSPSLPLLCFFNHIRIGADWRACARQKRVDAFSRKPASSGAPGKGLVFLPVPVV